MARPEAATVERVAVVGAGTIGASWAAHFLGRGMRVRAWDPAAGAEARLRAYVENAWPTVERLGAVAGADVARLEWCDTVEAALDGAQFVQESAPERHDVKVALYERFDAALPADAVMSTSSSGLLLSDLQAGRAGRERYVLGHPFNPPHLIPVVEVLGGRDTDPAVVDWTVDFYNAHGKKAVRLNREVPGHLVNRIQAALWREAAWAVESGLASVEDVDTAIAYGPGLRWAAMGPHMIFHLTGGPKGMQGLFDQFLPGLESWWADLRTPEMNDELKRRLLDGVLEEAGERDIARLEAERDAMLVAMQEALARVRASFAADARGADD